MLPRSVLYRLIRRRNSAICRQLLLMSQIDIPPSVEIGEDFAIGHRGHGIMVTEFAVIGSRVQIYPGATIGRSDVYRPGDLARIVIEDDCVLSTNAVVLGPSNQETTIGRGCVIGANAVVASSTGPWEIWAGNPAKKVGMRDPATASQMIEWRGR